MSLPQVTHNRFSGVGGYAWTGSSGGIFGTGTRTVVDLGRNLSNGIRFDSGSAGRGFLTFSNITVPANMWLGVLVEITDADLSGVFGTGSANAVIKLTVGGETGGTTYVSIQNIKDSGPGWYCITGQYAANTTLNIKVGVGTDSNLAADAFVTIGRVCYDIYTEETIPDMALPGYAAAYDTTGNSVDATRLVTFGETKIENLDKDYRIIYAIGDSKSNSKDSDMPFHLSTLFKRPTYVYSASGEGYNHMVDNLDYLRIGATKWVGGNNDTNRDIWADMDEFPKVPLRPNTLLFANFFVNDINSGEYSATQCIENAQTLITTLGFENVIITDMNPWKAGGFGHASDLGTSDAAKITDTKLFNSLAKALCIDKGWVHVPLYYEMGKKLPGDVDIMSDGQDGDLDMTDDGLHPFGTYQPLAAGLVECQLQEARQKR